jgi:hypothetical protein
VELGLVAIAGCGGRGQHRSQAEDAGEDRAVSEVKAL